MNDAYLQNKTATTIMTTTASASCSRRTSAPTPLNDNNDNNNDSCTNNTNTDVHYDVARVRHDPLSMIGVEIYLKSRMTFMTIV